MKTLCTIFAKGPTFADVPRVSDAELRVCINQAAIFTSDVDMIVCNDIESILDVLEHKQLTNETLYTPFYPHVDCMPGDHIETYALYQRHKESLYNFNLPSVSKLHDGLKLNTAISSTHTALEILCIRYPTISSIITYGFGIGTGYHPLFKSFDRSISYLSPGSREGDSITSLKQLLPDNVTIVIN